ncbi:unnamed protein product [Penicillium egyptiacum]|uniref:Uncharacterized protein n=1 Tax=Penicillium egyptiacum TaxID=1303716 RepID=A0A9W4KFP4_9EURO|nr:unnamed protein product [Penicillium egyptiacum]
MAEHLESCEMWCCWHCNKGNIPLAEKEEHKQTCSRYKCKHCFRIFAIGQKSEHQSNCQFRPNKMTKDEKVEHLRTCDYRPCRHCRKIIPVNAREAHEEHYEKWKCIRHCGITTPLSERHAHAAVFLEEYFRRAVDQSTTVKIDSYFKPISPQAVESQVQQLNISERDDEEEMWIRLFYEEMSMCMTDDELSEEDETSDTEDMSDREKDS